MKLYIAARAYQLDDPDPQVNAEVFLSEREAEKCLEDLGYKQEFGIGWVKRYEGVDDPPVTGIAVINVQDLKINIREL